MLELYAAWPAGYMEVSEPAAWWQRERIRSYVGGSAPTIRSTLSRSAAARWGSSQRASDAAISNSVSMASQ